MATPQRVPETGGKNPIGPCSRDHPPRARLRAALPAYIHFALEKTEFFRFMFGNAPDRPEAGRIAGIARVSILEQRGNGGVRRIAFRCQGGVIGAADPLLVANIVWAFTHGTACLVVDRHLKSPLSMEAYLNRSLDLFLDSLGA